MKLYAGNDPEPIDIEMAGLREASPAEILAAARPHADLQAADDHLEYLREIRLGDSMAEVIAAALGADDE